MTLRDAIERREEFVWANRVVPQDGWLERLMRERSKPFLLSETGAGVYPAETHFLVPEGQGVAWIARHLGPLLQRSAFLDSLIDPEIVMYHTGCLGDLIAACPILRQLGGGRMVVGNYTYDLREGRKMEGARYESIRPLLEVQPYVTSVRFEHNSPNTHDLSDRPPVKWRMPGWRSKHRRDRTLTESQADCWESTVWT